MPASSGFLKAYLTNKENLFILRKTAEKTPLRNELISNAIRFKSRLKIYAEPRKRRNNLARHLFA